MNGDGCTGWVGLGWIGRRGSFGAGGLVGVDGVDGVAGGRGAGRRGGWGRGFNGPLPGGPGWAGGRGFDGSGTGGRRGLTGGLSGGLIGGRPGIGPGNGLPGRGALAGPGFGGAAGRGLRLGKSLVGRGLPGRGRDGAKFSGLRGVSRNPLIAPRRAISNGSGMNACTNSGITASKNSDRVYVPLLIYSALTPTSIGAQKLNSSVAKYVPSSYPRSDTTVSVWLINDGAIARRVPGCGPKGGRPAVAMNSITSDPGKLPSP